MSRAAKSHVPQISGQLHPFHGMARIMCDANPQLLAIRDEARKVAHKTTPSLVDIVAIREHLRQSGKLKQLRGIVKRVVDAEPKSLQVGQLLPKPPPARELYGRIVRGSDILDVGSGNAKRLIQFEGQFNVTTQDPAVSETRIDAPHEQSRFEAPTSKVVTSFLALSNNKDVTPFVDSDGIHLVPRLDKLLTFQLAKQEGDAVVSKCGEEVFRDYPNSIPQTPVSAFYAGVNTFARRAIDVRTTGVVLGRGANRPSRGERCRFLPSKPGDCSLKYRGEFMILKKRRGTVCLVDRRGVHYEAQCGEAPELELYFEITPRGLRLFEVYLFHGFRPFHSLKAIEYFLERVSITIDGYELLAPERFDPRLWDPGRDDVEGIVYREGGKDFLVRENASIDVRCGDLPHFLTAIRESGLEITNVDPSLARPGEIEEYEIVIDGDTCTLDNKGMRNKERADDTSKVDEYLSWPIVRDFLTLFEDDTGLEPLPGFHEECLEHEPDTDSE